jgi:hypothetical protein
LRRAIGFDFSYLSTSKASPNDTGIVIIVIIIIGEVESGLHGGGIIAQRFDLPFSNYLTSRFFEVKQQRIQVLISFPGVFINTPQKYFIKGYWQIWIQPAGQAGNSTFIVNRPRVKRIMVPGTIDLLTRQWVEPC